MNGKGIVLEVKGSKLIVLTPDGRFRKIRSNGGELTGQEVWLAPEGRLRQVKMSWWLPAAAAALALLIAIPAMLAVRAEARPVVAYLSMDVNPSFELGVDEKLKVRSLRAVNKDATPFVEALKYEGRPVSEVMDRLASQLADTSYLHGDQANIVFAGVRLDGAAKELLSDLNLQAKAAFQKAAAQSGDANVKITQIESTPGVMDEAADLGLSTGQMTVYLLAKDEGYSVSLDQFRTKPLQAAATWKGGIGALVGDAEELNQDKLNRLLEKEKQERASEASGSSGSSTAPSPTPKPKTSSLGAGELNHSKDKPSAEETKPAAVQPSASSTKTPPTSQKHLPKPKVSAVESHLTPLPDLERNQSREEDREEHEEREEWDKWQAELSELEEWKKYTKQQKENWLKKKKAEIEKLREEAEKAHKELERSAREAEERLKQAEEKWKKDAKKQDEERLKEHETKLKQEKQEKQKEQEERLEKAEEKWEEAEEEWEEAEYEWEEAEEEWDDIEEEWEERLEQHFGH
ncbi:Anti-sigma factor N-terminus [Paenibacillaceae bacterium GAS479]|nr:Anti-sigma factor N-terminus [Paenibacillaceae bacterium GAS479]